MDQKAKARARAREWYKKNRKKAIAYQRAYKKRYPEKVRELSRRSLYGRLPPEPKNCEACGIPFAATKKGSCVDHDHETGQVRGYLCNGCNLALGHVGDSRDRLQLLMNYLDVALLK